MNGARNTRDINWIINSAENIVCLMCSECTAVEIKAQC